MRAIDRELQDYVNILNEEQKKTVLKVAKALAPDSGNEEDWEDENFIAEIDEQCNRYHRTAGAATSRNERRDVFSAGRN